MIFLKEIYMYFGTADESFTNFTAKQELLPKNCNPTK